MQTPYAINDLDARWGRAGSVTFAEKYGGAVAVLAASGGTALVALKGAQILSWRPAGAAECFWLSPLARLDGAKAVRGGVPICWPWFGPHPIDPNKPAHGFVRTAPWQVVGSAASEGRARIVLTIDTRDLAPDLWPYHAQAEIEITLSQSLTIALTTTNSGSQAFALSQALHSYFAVSDIGNVAIAGLENRPFIDQLRGNETFREPGPIAFAGEVDRIYQDTGAVSEIIDGGSGRRIRVSATGSRSSVVWNPWIAKGERLGDLGPEGYRKFVCLETANAGRDLVTVAAGARHRLSAEFSVEEKPRIF